MRKAFGAGVAGLVAAMVLTLPVSAHHNFGTHGEENHECSIVPEHFCALAREVCDWAGYCMDDHSRGYCNQSCYTAPVTQTSNASQAAPQEAPAESVQQDAQMTQAAPQEAPAQAEIPEQQSVQAPQEAPAQQTYYQGGGHHGRHHGGHHGCY